MDSSFTFFISWSGGKDSCLALYRAMQRGGKPLYLLTMMDESGRISRSHHIPLSVLQSQSDSLGVPLLVRSSLWETYEEVFSNTLKELKGNGIDSGVFGDIDLEEHRAWNQKVCSANNITDIHPLWQIDRTTILKNFLEAGFQATIVAAKDNCLSPIFLGRSINNSTIAEIESLGLDACGENGEFHTIVTDGPLFSYPINLSCSEKTLHDGYWFLNPS
ncbi:MAG: diphthine--ammonia ligase [Chitinophagales bacterium]